MEGVIAGPSDELSVVYHNATNVGVIILRTLVLYCYERWCYYATKVGAIMLRMSGIIMLRTFDVIRLRKLTLGLICRLCFCIVIIRFSIVFYIMLIGTFEKIVRDRKSGKTLIVKKRGNWKSAKTLIFKNM